VSWLARHPRFHMYFTFTYSSWLDQVERWAALLTDKRLRLATHTSVAALEKTSATGSPNGTKTQSHSHGPKPPTKSLNDSPHLYCEFMAHDTRGASIGPPRWLAGFGGIVAAGYWLRSGPSLSSDDRGAAARLGAGQDRLDRSGWLSWLQW
jgi:hypothetical protein